MYTNAEAKAKPDNTKRATELSILSVCRRLSHCDIFLSIKVVGSLSLTLTYQITN